MPNRVFAWLWLLLILPVGCASIHSQKQLERVNELMEQAEQDSAREYATYHFHRAHVFRDRARLEIAHAKYDVASEYLTIVEASLSEAIKVTEQRKELERRRNQRHDGSVLTPSPASDDAESGTP